MIKDPKDPACTLMNLAELKSQEPSFFEKLYDDPNTGGVTVQLDAMDENGEPKQLILMNKSNSDYMESVAMTHLLKNLPIDWDDSDDDIWDRLKTDDVLWNKLREKL